MHSESISQRKLNSSLNCHVARVCVLSRKHIRFPLSWMHFHNSMIFILLCLVAYSKPTNKQKIIKFFNQFDMNISRAFRSGGRHEPIVFLFRLFSFSFAPDLLPSNTPTLLLFLVFFLLFRLVVVSINFPFSIHSVQNHKRWNRFGYVMFVHELVGWLHCDWDDVDLHELAGLRDFL